MSVQAWADNSLGVRTASGDTQRTQAAVRIVHRQPSIAYSGGRPCWPLRLLERSFLRCCLDRTHNCNGTEAAENLVMVMATRVLDIISLSTYLQLRVIDCEILIQSKTKSTLSLIDGQHLITRIRQELLTKHHV